MFLSIDHRTTYHYDGPVPYGLMQVRLHARSGRTQRLLDWTVTVDGGTKQVEFADHHGNLVALYSTDAGRSDISVHVDGHVETTSNNSVIAHEGVAPMWLYLRQTPLTVAGAEVQALSTGLTDTPPVAELHDLSARIRDIVRYETGSTHAGSTAEEAVAAGAGVCQDHAHVFIGACRHVGIPARYVSGYLLLTEESSSEASHAWAESWVQGLGWVGFDVSNGISPDERYVRIAAGLDYDDVAPISGVRHGAAGESMDVSLEVRQEAQQQ